MPPGAAGNNDLPDPHAPDRRRIAALGMALAVTLAGHVAAVSLAKHLLVPRGNPAKPTLAPVIVLSATTQTPGSIAAPEVPSPRRQELQGKVPADAAPANSATYLSTSDVDQPAVPLQDFEIDTGGLPLGTMYRAVLDVFVDATGQVRNIDIIELTPDDNLARKALLKLYATPMSPALLKSQPVGNVRHLEISFGQE